MEAHSVLKQIVLRDRQYNVREVCIPVPWGQLVGKWYGPADVRPILCLHGYLDNGGSFNKLLPLLPKHLSYLAIDFPGHGHSSHIPKGSSYHWTQFLSIPVHLMRTYGWPKVSLLGHSFGGMIAFLFAGLFPAQTDLLMVIENLTPYYFDDKLVHATNNVERLVEIGTRSFGQSEPPSRDFQYYVDRMSNSTFFAMPPDVCGQLLHRNLRCSSKRPGVYYSALDSRLKNVHLFDMTEDHDRCVARRIACPTLMIKSVDTLYASPEELQHEALDIIRGNGVAVEFVTLPGCHHLHLENAEGVANAVGKFLRDHYAPVGPCKL